MRSVNSVRKSLLLLFLLPLSQARAADCGDRVKDVVNNEVKAFLQDARFKAASVALYVKGRECQYHFGTLEDGKAPDGNSRYEIGSITKAYTGMLLARAVLDKKVRLDDDVRRYLRGTGYASLDKAGSFITLRHLASHTSGLPKDFAYAAEDQKNGSVVDKLSRYSKKVFFEDLKRIELLSVPGREYRYSNVGAELVAYVLEDLYGESYESLLQRYVFSGTGEMGTMLSSSRAQPLDIVVGRNEKGEQMPLLSRYLYAEGGLTSTTGSMLRFLAYNASSRQPIVRESQSLIGGNTMGNGRAYFWNTFDYRSPGGMLYHNGGTLGTSSWIAVYPKEKLGVFLITNTSTSDSQGTLNTVSNRIVDRIKTLD